MTDRITADQTDAEWRTIEVLRDEADKDVLIECPTLVLRGKEFELGGKIWDFREVRSGMARRAEYVSLPRCGRLPREERPAEVHRELPRFPGSSQ